MRELPAIGHGWVLLLGCSRDGVCGTRVCRWVKERRERARRDLRAVPQGLRDGERREDFRCKGLSSLAAESWSHQGVNK